MDLKPLKSIKNGKKSKKNYIQKIYFKQFLEKNPEATVITDCEHNIITVNNAFQKLFDYNINKLVAKNLDKIIVPGEKFQESVQINQQLKKGRTVKIETYRKKSDGSKVYIELISFSINLNNEEKLIFGIYKDISKRKKLQEKIIENKKKIEKLHNISLEMVKCKNIEEIYNLTVDAGERILDFNVCTLDIVEDNKFVVKATSTGVAKNGSVSMPIDKSLGGKAYRYKKSYLTKDLRKDSEAMPVNDSYKSALTVPIGKYGVFQVISKKVNDFDNEDLKMAELLISHTVASINRLEAKKVINYLGFHDKLTGLYNRSFLEEECKRLNTHRQLPFSIIMADVNGLKMINDSLGHQQGDKLLKSAARIIKGTCREEDIIGRWGGDEFVILLPETTEKDADKIINRIKYKCENEESEIPISIAMGRATKQNQNKKLDELLQEADHKMYRKKSIESTKTRDKIIKVLIDKLGEKNYETKQHCLRMKKLAEKIAKCMNISNKNIKKLTLAATIHDIGFINIDDKLLNKSKGLTEKEWEIIKTHTKIGYKIALSSSTFACLSEIILYHHERWDGLGYPEGLAGKEIPLMSRIISVIDAYDVMTHKQVYKEPVSNEKAIKELRRCSGTQFDPYIVDVFINKVLLE